MATMNPLERKARNSFIKGIVIAGLIGLIGVIALGMMLMQMKGEEQQRLDALVSVRVLKQNVKSGQLIDDSMFKTVELDPDVAPSDALTSTSDFFLVDQYNRTVRDATQFNEATQQEELVLDENGNPMHAVIIENDDGSETQCVISNFNPDTATGTIQYTLNNQNVTEQVTLQGVPAMAKVDMSANTIVTSGMIERSFELTTDSLRKQEYNMISVPADIETDDVVDVRLRMPDGTDYIVVSKKRITMLDAGGIPSLTTFSIELTEDEILTLSNAIVEAYMMEGSKLYVTRYVDAGMQEAASTTYIPNADVQSLINSDPNIVEEAKTAMRNQAYNYGGNRNNINDELGKMDEDERSDAVSTGTRTEISDGQDERQSYLDSLQQ